MQSRSRHRRRIKAALEGETRFHRRVVKGADDKVFAAVPLRTVRQFFIFVREALHDLRPWNIAAGSRQDRQRT
ncbi:MAG: hypothetical protein DMF47_04135 [Verrucomicrobia bacterium]|nr:MAG: hypothetical protein DMF47_04135 [Verrucomicrobiota bacterium]